MADVFIQRDGCAISAKGYDPPSPVSPSLLALPSPPLSPISPLPSPGILAAALKFQQRLESLRHIASTTTKLKCRITQFTLCCLSAGNAPSPSFIFNLRLLASEAVHMHLVYACMQVNLIGRHA